ncbi:MAG: radical SAM/SPASM domain-containing protein [Pseudomonadota bacterium]
MRTAIKFKRINIEVSNICNLKCSFCPEVERSQKVMSVSEFESLLGKVANVTEEVVPHLLGEPLNHPHIMELLDTAHRKNVRVNLTTNGVILSEQRMGVLLHPALRQVNISLQSFTDNFKGASPQTYMAKISRFVVQAEQLRPDLYINLRFWDNDVIVNSLSPSDIMVSCSEAFQFSWSDVKVDVRRKKNFKIRDRLYLHFDSRFIWPRLDSEKLSEKGFCHGLSGHIGIHADGTVVPCCLDDKGVLALGNLHTQSLESILASPKAQNMLEGFKKGELREDLCQKCDYVKRFSRHARPQKKDIGKKPLSHFHAT